MVPRSAILPLPIQTGQNATEQTDSPRCVRTGGLLVAATFELSCAVGFLFMKAKLINLSDLRDSDVSRFWKYVPKRPSDGCWIWRGTIASHTGYGMMSVSHAVSRSLTAHRLSWAIHHQLTPAILYVLHKCDNKRCVNPAHLFLGTSQDNMNDAKSKERFVHSENHYNAKLKNAQVRMIRSAYKDNPARGMMTKLAKTFHVSLSTVWEIIHCWKWNYLR